MRLKFIPVMDIFATIENHRSSHRGTCFDADKPVAFETRPTSAVTAKWNPVKVVAVNNIGQRQFCPFFSFLEKGEEKVFKVDRS